MDNKKYDPAEIEKKWPHNTRVRVMHYVYARELKLSGVKRRVWR